MRGEGSLWKGTQNPKNQKGKGRDSRGRHYTQAPATKLKKVRKTAGQYHFHSRLDESGLVPRYRKKREGNLIYLVPGTEGGEEMSSSSSGLKKKGLQSMSKVKANALRLKHDRFRSGEDGKSSNSGRKGEDGSRKRNHILSRRKSGEGHFLEKKKTELRERDLVKEREERGARSKTVR